MPQNIGDMSATWGTATQFTGIKYNVIGTDSSLSTSLLMDLQVGGASRFSVSKAGGVAAQNGSASAPAFRGTDADSGIFFDGNNTRFAVDGSIVAAATGGGIGMRFANALAIGVTVVDTDVILARDAANTLAQRNGTNAQTFRLYNTFTDVTNNFERGKIAWESNVLRIGTEKGAVAGSARALEFQTDGTTRLTIAANGVVTTSTSLSVGGEVSVGSSNTLNWPSGTYLFGKATTGAIANTLRIVGPSGTAVNFGGDTSAFPALKRDTVRLQARLADDSAFTNIQGKITTEANAVAETPTATHTLTIYDAAGTAYKVLAVAA